jgi:hypothetical protein
MQQKSIIYHWQQRNVILQNFIKKYTILRKLSEKNWMPNQDDGSISSGVWLFCSTLSAVHPDSSVPPCSLEPLSHHHDITHTTASSGHSASPLQQEAPLRRHTSHTEASTQKITRSAADGHKGQMARSDQAKVLYDKEKLILQSKVFEVCVLSCSNDVNLHNHKCFYFEGA